MKESYLLILKCWLEGQEFYRHLGACWGTLWGWWLGGTIFVFSLSFSLLPSQLINFNLPQRLKRVGTIFLLFFCHLSDCQYFLRQACTCTWCPEFCHCLLPRDTTWSLSFGDQRSWVLSPIGITPESSWTTTTYRVLHRYRLKRICSDSVKEAYVLDLRFSIGQPSGLAHS